LILIIIIDDLLGLFQFLNINHDTPEIQINYTNPSQQITDGFDFLSYEQLSALCDEIGYHKVGITNIDNVAPSSIKIKDTDNDENNDDNDNMCTICLDNKYKAIYIRKINGCNHDFCGECIEKWLSENKTCPICKLELVEKDAIDAIDNTIPAAG
jgi:hypothetical protein